MPKTRQQKEQTLAELSQKFSTAKSVVFARYMGLTVADVQELRKELKVEEGEMMVAKKSLIKRMLKDAGSDDSVVDNMESGVAVVFGFKDEVASAKILANFAKTHDVVSFYAGVLEGKTLSGEEVVALSKLPSKQELLAKMVGSMNAPISGLVNVFAGNQRNLMTVLTRISEQKSA